MNFVQRFLRKGTENCSDQFDARRIRLLNLFYIIATVTLLSSLIQSLVVGEPLVDGVVLIAACVLAIGIPFLGRKNPNLGAVYMILFANGLVWFFANSQGLAAGTYFFYFPLFFANGWLMDFRKLWNAALMLGITVSSVVLLLIIPESVFGLSVTREIQEASFVFNLTCASLIMAVNTLVIVWMNYKRQQELEVGIEKSEKASALLAAALKEKEILLAEIHHRVKNNLAVVRGLLNMQLNSTTDEIAKNTLRESVNRVTSMGLIHQKLYGHENPDSIHLTSYVNDLVREISSSFSSGDGESCRVNTHVEDISLTLNRAVPCGLILNELLSNAFKHAFEGQKKGVIDIEITRDKENQGLLNLVVTDNGSGIPLNFDPQTSTSLGISIVQSLCEQLDGNFTYTSSERGTQMKVNFPILNVE